jgi:superfamily II DNA or RNA helicase
MTAGFPYWDKALLPAWKHQTAELDDYWDAPSRALFWQPRTGKTKAVIDTLCAWHVARGLRTALIVAPNGVHANWTRVELPKHAWTDYTSHAWSSRHANSSGHSGHSASLDAALRARGLCVLAFGKESLLSPSVQSVVKKALRRGPCALVVDESHHFRTPGAKRTRAARGLAKRCAMRRILTGTPTGNSPLGLFSQFELLHPGALGFGTSKAFTERYAVFSEGYSRSSGRSYPIMEGYQNLDELMERVARWSSVILRKDCEDLPEMLASRQSYEPSATQAYVYEKLRKDFVAELDSGARVEAAEASLRLIRLQQVLSNFVVSEDYDVETVDQGQDPRLDALVEAVSGKTIVWCRFRECIRRASGRLREAGLRVVEYHGTVSDEDRVKALLAFQDGDADVIVAQPSCAGEGLDLSAAETVIWYSHVFDVVVRDQASERATKIGGRAVSLVDIVVPESVDDYILDNLTNKRSVAEEVTGSRLKDILKECEI